mmetsp:Transcript_11085/g.23903  ORF Transcript_11085/g.23903 Transcript_11085/m.23903 type:complete len:801 (-) Transcript_11085:769-3171(-)|eukprot:CAMPEP_0202922584 /NCGR_PEP_ID=MMETSP1392-20130828/77985_1 /ASSEMBLY_ACC=CAM_ASM_000868 /TAXON_ID=225041 /ORGANISM="Chlamydomonas chlamydogama, Strain SAG 11-48b" /LENGTH=800 /DNA_ID=CAMNT_0049616215 /DNA_START=66 /DNA_END=2468 /DNA_ORIENTATION=+
MAWRQRKDDPLPQGWLDCPNFGMPPRIDEHHQLNIIPSKVPLSRFFDQWIPPNKRYCLGDAIRMLAARRMEVGMVVDLTNSTRYYDFGHEVPDYADKQISYVKVACRGRGQSPAPAEVNHAVFEIWRFLEYYPSRYVLVHCTHGFNRTGYVIVCALMRLAADMGMTVDRAVRRFVDCRAPGIYKDGYINDLFKYHHEVRNTHKIRTPPVPGWKGEDRDDGDDEDTEGQPPPPPPPPISHDKIEEIGEPLVQEEVDYVLGEVGRVLLPQRPEIKFPGSQPVSLDRSNLDLIRGHRYWVTWKADGTRYMMWISKTGCYLIDRSAKVVRLQMRFPTNKVKRPGVKPDYPVGRPHHRTLLDGEMVVDHDKATGQHMRRYLAYDIMMINGAALVHNPFIERFKVIETDIVKPRSVEAAYIEGGIQPGHFTAPPLSYNYKGEPFSVRRKDFWPLYMGRKLISKFIPQLCHESDGLILQAMDDPYKPLTCNELLKWKFAHMNSVDFTLQVTPRPGQPIDPALDCSLAVMGRKRGRAYDEEPDLLFLGQEHKVFFPPELHVDVLALHNRIIECAWDSEVVAWRFMRTRLDKKTPNAKHVFEKVMRSIADGIHEEELLGFLEWAFVNEAAYQADRAKVPPGCMPEPRPPAPPPDEMAHLAANGHGHGQPMDPLQEAPLPLHDTWEDGPGHPCPPSPPYTFQHAMGLDGPYPMPPAVWNNHAGMNSWGSAAGDSYHGAGAGPGPGQQQQALPVDPFYSDDAPVEDAQGGGAERPQHSEPTGSGGDLGNDDGLDGGYNPTSVASDSAGGEE